MLHDTIQRRRWPSGVWRGIAAASAGAALLLTLLPPPTPAALASATGATGATGGRYDWLQYDGNPAHSGDNMQETALGAANVARLHRIFRVVLPSFVDGAPVSLHDVPTPGGMHDLLFVTTYASQALALDAHTGATVWQRGYTSRQSCASPFWTHRQTTEPCYTYSSPAVDPTRRYVYSYGMDGYVHKYAVGTGAEIVAGGWPKLVTRKPAAEKLSSALGMATARSGTSYLYAVTSSFGDAGDYQGHLTTINLSSGAQHVFNALCGDRVDVHFALTPAASDCPRTGAGLWGRAGVVYDGDTDEVYLAVGNGPYNPAAHDWGQSVIALRADGSVPAAAPLDRYTPADYDHLNVTDADLGSTDPAILPTLTHGSVRRLAVQGAKDGTLRLLNLDRLGGQAGQSGLGGEVGAALKAPQGEGVLSQPAVWVDPSKGNTWVFVGNGKGLSALTVTTTSTGTPGMNVMWSTRQVACTSPLVANGVLYCAANGHIRALDPVSGAVLWQDTGIGSVHWSSPVVANGILYIADKSHALTAYAPTT